MNPSLQQFFMQSPVPPQQLAASLWMIIALPLLGAFICGILRPRRWAATTSAWSPAPR